MPSAPRPGNLTWGCSELASPALNTDAEAEARPALAEVGTRPWRKKSDCPKARLKQVRQSDTLGSRLHLSCLLRRAACPVLWQKHLSGRLAALGISSAPPDNIEGSQAADPTRLDQPVRGRDLPTHTGICKLCEELPTPQDFALSWRLCRVGARPAVRKAPVQR